MNDFIIATDIWTFKVPKYATDIGKDISNTNIAFSELDRTDNILLRSFLKFEYYFSQALNNNEPHHLADYLYEISNLFN